MLRAVASSLALALHCALRLAPFAPAMVVALFGVGLAGFGLAQVSMALLLAMAGRPVLGRTMGPGEQWATFIGMGVCVALGAAVMLRWWWGDLKQSDERIRALCREIEARKALP